MTHRKATIATLAAVHLALIIVAIYLGWLDLLARPGVLAKVIHQTARDPITLAYLAAAGVCYAALAIRLTRRPSGRRGFDVLRYQVKLDGKTYNAERV
jgi:hypothetical protein